MKNTILILLTLLTCVARAGQLKTWNGNGATADYTDNANWNGGTAPADGDSLSFPAGPVNKICRFAPGHFSFSQITFSDGGYQIAGDATSTIAVSSSPSINVTAAAGTVRWGPYLELASFQGVNVSNTGVELDLESGITGTGRPSFQGKGIFGLGGVGSWTSTGSFLIYANAKLLSATAIPPTITVNLDSAASLDTNGFDLTVASMAGSGLCHLNSSTLTLTPPISSGSNVIFDGDGLIDIPGPGQQDFSGVSPTFTGSVNVHGSGKCQFNGTFANANVTVRNNATLIMAGRCKSLVFNDNSVCQMALAGRCGSAAFNGSSKFKAFIVNSNFFSQLTCDGEFTINGGSFDCSVDAATPGESFSSIIWNSVTGQFVNAADNSPIVLNGINFRAHYNQTSFIITAEAPKIQTNTTLSANPSSLKVVYPDAFSLSTEVKDVNNFFATGEAHINVTSPQESIVVPLNGSGPGIVIFQRDPGQYDLLAEYLENQTYYGSQSGPLTVEVLRGNANVAISGSPKPDLQGNRTFKVTVSPPASGAVPTGLVVLNDISSDGNTVTVIDTQMLVNGEITFSVPPGVLSNGLHKVSATYKGDNHYNSDAKSNEFNFISYVPKPNDFDADGYHDSEEKVSGAASDDPSDTPGPSNMPLGDAKPGLTIKSIKIALNSKKTHADSHSLAGTIPLNNSALPDTIIINIGDNAALFTKNAKNKYVGARTAFTLRAKGNTGFFAFAASKTDLAAALTDEGLTTAATAKKDKKPVTIRCIANGVLYSVEQQVLWTAKIGVSGSAIISK